MDLGHTDALPDHLLRVRNKLTLAAEYWAEKATQTRHASDAQSYAEVAEKIAALAGKVELLRFNWTPQPAEASTP